ncbi:MAG: hypothetical protein AB1801_16180 [Chloroflexota bacterium]
MVSLPVLFAYIIPGLGTNWLRLWEFNTRWRLGRFRPHHGFVFGSSISLLALLCVVPPAANFRVFEMLGAGFITGSTLAFWNWLYDIQAIKVGLLVVYNRPYAQQGGPEAIATDYAPLFFGVFGGCYGLAIYLGQHLFLTLGRWEMFWALFIGCLLILLAMPVLAYLAYSYLKYGDAGLKPFTGE